MIISSKDCDRASLTGFKKADNTEENTEDAGDGREIEHLPDSTAVDQSTAVF